MVQHTCIALAQKQKRSHGQKCRTLTLDALCAVHPCTALALAIVLLHETQMR